MLATVRRGHAHQATALDQRVGNVGLDQHLSTAVLDGGGQRRDQLARVDRGLVRRVGLFGSGCDEFTFVREGGA